MKANLLIVDDDYSVRDSLRKLLEREGYEVFPARDGSEALELFNSQEIDLVVLDINLGSDDGWEVFEAMAGANPFVPVIVITAMWGQRGTAVMLGAEALIEKPIDVPHFLNMIRELLDETTESKLMRICGDDAHCRYAGRHYEPYLRMLQERYNAPFRIEDSTSGLTDTDTEAVLPTVIGASLDFPDTTGNAGVRPFRERRRKRKEQLT